MGRDRKDINPLLVKFGVALALSFAGFLYSRLKTRRTQFSPSPQSPGPSDHGTEVDDVHVMKRTPSSGNIAVSTERHDDAQMVKVAVSPNSKHSGDKDGYLLPEFNDLMKEFDFPATNTGILPKKDAETPRSSLETPRAFRSVENDNYEQEIGRLKNTVRMLRERERSLEFKLLEFYGLKEQETAVMELQNHLKINNMEVKLLSLKIDSLQGDNRRLQAQVDDHAKIVAELDAARAKIRVLTRKLRSEAEQNKEQILSLRKKVSTLQEQELNAATTDPDIQLKLQRLKDLETEAEALRISNSRLHVENSELAHQLESTQILANSVIEDSESEELKELDNQLRQENEDLAKQVERLQADRCADAEELVYLRWINACLRYELRNFQPAHGKTVARDLSKSLSPKSEEKAKELILEYANTEGEGERGIMDFEPDHWPSFRDSYMTDLGDYDDSSGSSKTNRTTKIKIFKKIRRLILGKDIQHHSAGTDDRTGGVEDSDSPCGSSSISTVTDATSDLQSNRAQTPSFNSSLYSSSRSSRHHSVDIQRMKSLKLDDVKDSENGERNSSTISSHGHGRFSSSRELGSYLSLENQLDKDLYSLEKSKLMRFAEVLKDSGSRTGKLHRKAASMGSFGSLWRSASG